MIESVQIHSSDVTSIGSLRSGVDPTKFFSVKRSTSW